MAPTKAWLIYYDAHFTEDKVEAQSAKDKNRLVNHELKSGDSGI